MPKPLYDWLHYSALKWMMPEETCREDHGGTWHKSAESNWTQCGRWVAGLNCRDGAGFGPHWYKKKSPWWGRGSLPIHKLCQKCFAEELPILALLESVAVQGGTPLLALQGDR